MKSLIITVCAAGAIALWSNVAPADTLSVSSTTPPSPMSTIE